MAIDYKMLIKAIADEKHIPENMVIEILEEALAKAYRKDFGAEDQNVIMKFDPETGVMSAYDIKTVIEDELAVLKTAEEYALEKELEEKKKAEATVESSEEKEEIKEGDSEEGAVVAEGEEEKFRYNPRLHISLSEAKKIKKDSAIGDELVQSLEIPADFGRIAAQTAKQVIVQKLKEVERTMVYDKYKDLAGKVISGVVQRRERVGIIVDLDDAQALLPNSEQVENERYMPGSKMKFFVVAVNQTARGPEIILSHARAEIVKELFTVEIPEIRQGHVEIMGIAREVGNRTKIAVKSNQENVDPIGSCIGQRGVRIQTIISQLGGEKIDVIEWSDDPKTYVQHALSPAKISSIEIDEKNKRAAIYVKEDQFSLAVGRYGQNVRLASQLTGFEIDIRKAKEENASNKAEETAENTEEAIESNEVAEVTNNEEGKVTSEENDKQG